MYGRFVLVASEGGVTFWTGNHPLARGEGDLAANPELKRAELDVPRAHPGLTAEELEPLYYRDALRVHRGQPGWWLALLGAEGRSTRSCRSARRIRYTREVLGGVGRLLSARAAARARRHSAAVARRRRGRRALLLLARSAVLVCLVFFPQERFRIPVIDPTLIVCAAAALQARR